MHAHIWRFCREQRHQAGLGLVGHARGTYSDCRSSDRGWASLGGCLCRPVRNEGPLELIELSQKGGATVGGKKHVRQFSLVKKHTFFHQPPPTKIRASFTNPH